ncbi:HAD family hydrolase [Kaarinaea lacus]
MLAGNKSRSDGVKNVVFDLGAVLLEWNPEEIVRQFSSDSLQQDVVRKEIFQHPDWLEMDRGGLSEIEAINRAVQRTRLDANQLASLFDMVKESLTVIPESLQVLEKALAKGFDLYCLSNMSPETYAHIRRRYSFFDYFHGIVISGLEKTVKPEKKIFQILLQRYCLNPDETLFIDDRIENTHSAAELGMSIVTFSGTPECYSKISFYIDS